MPQIVPADGPYLDPFIYGPWEIWHAGLSREAYERFWRAQRKTSWGRRNLEGWVLVDGGDVLAGAKVYRFDAVLDGRAIRVAGLGAVFTQTVHRRRGAARELIEGLLARASADGADLALLFSEIGPGYYERLGFETIPIADSTLRVIEDDRRGAPMTMVRAGDERDLADIASIDALRAEPFRFHLRRDTDLIRFALTKRRLLAGLSPSGRRELQFFIAEEGASAVAYVAISVEGGAWTLDSCGDRDPSGARIGAILQVLVAREPSVRRAVIKGWLPDTLRPPQIEIVASAPLSDVAMMKPLTGKGRPDAPLTSDSILYWRGDAF